MLFCIDSITNMDSVTDQQQRYKLLSTEQVKHTNVQKSICFSFPTGIGKLLGETFLYRLCDAFAKFICDAFDIDKDFIEVSKYNKNTPKFRAHLINIKSSTSDFIINNSGIIAKRILQELVYKNPKIVFRSGSHMSKKTKAMESDKVIDMVDDRIIKSIMDDIFIGMLKAAEPAIELVDIPHHNEIYKRYGSLEITEYLTYIMIYRRHTMFNYSVKIYDNLNISGDSEIAKSNLEFVEFLFTKYVDISRRILVIVSKSQNKVIVVSGDSSITWDSIFTVCDCSICGEVNIIRQNMIPIKDSDDMCIICAKKTQSSREMSFETLNQIACYSGDCGEKGIMFYIFRQGVYIFDKDNHPIKVSDAYPWMYRGVLFMKYLDEVIYPKYIDMFTVKQQEFPDANSASIMYDAIIDILDQISSKITKYIEEVSGIQQIIPIVDFLQPFRDLLTNVNTFRDELIADKSPEHILKKSKYTGELMRQFGIIYYPTFTEINSYYIFNDFSDKVHSTLPRGIIVNDEMNNLLKAIIKLLEDVRCHCFCDYCKNLMMKLDACDTGNCINCSRAFCMEHGTVLTKDHIYCDFKHNVGSNCVAFFHQTAGGFRWDNVPTRLDSTCVCKLY
jgi:hypothetical protein